MDIESDSESDEESDEDMPELIDTTFIESKYDGFMQLANKGIQDTYLTATPDMTFFKTECKRHENFSIPEFGKTVSYSIPNPKYYGCMSQLSIV